MRPLSLPAPLRAVHLAVLSAFAVAQPLYDILDDAPQFFVVRESTRIDVVVFALAVTLLPPAAFLLGELLAGLVTRAAADALHLVFVAGLVALFAMQVLKDVDGASAGLVVAGSAALGAAGAAAYALGRPVRSFVTVLAPVPILFVALFLARSPLDELGISPEQTARAAPKLAAPSPVVMIVFDELPTTSLMNARGRVDAGRYPNFARLASSSTWFRNATVMHEHTTSSVPTILSGRVAKLGRLPLLSEYPENIFTALGRSYRYHVFEPITQLCPTELCPRDRDPFGRRMESLASDLGIVYLHVLLPDAYTRDLPSVTETWEGFADDHGGENTATRRRVVVADKRGIDRVIGRELWRDPRSVFARFVAGIRPTDPPTFAFLHSLLPHAPWRFLPSGAQYGEALGTDGLVNDTWADDPWLVTQAWQRHLLQVGFTDRLLGDLLRRLRATGLYDRSLIVITSDHGTSFVPGERRRGVTPANIHDVAGVPLFIKRPHQQRGEIVDRVVRSVDVTPTIADVLGVPLRGARAGRSLFDPGYREPRRIVVHQRTSTDDVTVATGVLKRRQAATLRRMVSIFGTGSIERLFAIGPHRELLRRRLAAVRTVQAAGPQVEIDGEALLRNVDPASALSPSHITGRLIDAPERALPLAIAVNGRIGAVTRTFRTGSTTRFAALVPESAFRPGPNEVEVFAVRRRDRRFELHRLERAGGAEAQYTLVEVEEDERGRAGERIETPTGVVPVVPGRVAGRVEDWFVEADSIRFGGWAGDLRAGRLPERVLVFEEGRFLYGGTTSVERRDIARRHPRLIRAGFVFELPDDLVDREGESELRFFAIAGGVASELAYHPRFPWK